MHPVRARAQVDTAVSPGPLLSGTPVAASSVAKRAQMVADEAISEAVAAATSRRSFSIRGSRDGVATAPYGSGGFLPNLPLIYK